MGSQESRTRKSERPDPAADPGKVVIKKYSDRRLYDTGARRYVNIDEIARMIREGTEVEVREARTGKDLTRVILTQIIMEDSREDASGPPLNLLRQLVAISDRTTHDFLSHYLDTASDLYRKTGTALRSGVSEARSAVTNPLDFVRHLLNDSPPPDTEDSREEVQQLRKRVEQLEALLATRSRSSRKPRKGRV